MYMKNIFQSLSIATLLGLFVPFISPITTRYLKYQIITISTNGRTDVTEFNVYEPKSE